MDALHGKNLINKNGETITDDDILKDLKLVVFLFCSQDVPDIDILLKELKSVHVESHRRNLGIEIVYVPLDHNPYLAKAHFEKHGSWYKVPADNNFIGELIFKYGIIKDPTVMVIRKDGKIISWDAEFEIKEIGLNVLVTWPER